MDNQMKETNIVIKLRNYNGTYGIGSIFNNEFNVFAKQLVNNPNKEKGLIIFTENIGFCCDEKLGSNPLATIKTEIPFSVDYDKFTIFNEMVEKIKTNPDYKYNESHYATDKFDPKRLEYFDIIIDGEDFESKSDEIFKTILHDVIDVEEISGVMDDYYHNLIPIMKRMNKPAYAQSTIQNSNNAEIDKVSQIVNEVAGTADMDKNNLLCKLVKKVIELPFDTETTIAKLMQLDQVLIDPLTQGEIFNSLMKVCEKLSIKIEVNHDEFGGLGYHYKFKKIENKDNDKKMFSQDELKELFYRTMNQNEISKLNELGMNEEIAKLNTPTHQVKYFDGIGYILIGDGYIIQANGMEQQKYFATIVNSPEEARKEILKKIPRQVTIDNSISSEINKWEMILSKSDENDYVTWITGSRTIASNLLYMLDKLLITDDDNIRKMYDLVKTIGVQFNDRDFSKIKEIVSELKSLNEKVNTSTDANNKNNIEYLFEKDENEKFIRLVIPNEFVKTIIPSSNTDMNLIGKGNLDLSSEEVSVLKIYARELREKNTDDSKKQYTFSYNEYKSIFEKNDDDTFIRLIIPANDKYKELNLIGKIPTDFTLDEIIRLKQYSKYVYDHVLDPHGQKNIENTVNVLVDVIEHLSSGKEISISEILGNNVSIYDSNELFDINSKTLEKCENNGIKLNFDKYNGQYVGLPFNIPFIKE